MKKTIGILLALILALTMLPSAAFAEGEITGFDGLKAAAGTAGEYTLGADIAVSETLEISADVTINGGGKTLTYAEGFTGSVFKVNNGGKLTLKNVVIDGGYTDWSVNTDNNTITFVAGSGTPKSAAPVTNANGIVVLSGITITNLVRDMSNKEINSALLETKYSGSATLTDIRMENCYGGGGLLVSAEQGANVTINGNSEVSNSSAIKNGAFIRCVGGIQITIDGLKVHDNNFSNNGLVMAGHGKNTVKFENSEFKNNTHYGNSLGGIFYAFTQDYNSSNNNTVSITNTAITDNQTQGNGSGSLVISTTSKTNLTIEKGCNISGNGGSIFVSEDGILTIDKGATIEEDVRISKRGQLINNGTINGSAIVGHYDNWDNPCPGSAYVTNNGTITGGLTIRAKWTSPGSTSSGNVKGTTTFTTTTDENTGKTSNLTITGGYYGNSIEEITPYLADGLRAIPSDNPEYICMVVPASMVRVSFDVNGGDALVPSFTYTDGQGVLSQFPAATRANYRFNGWYTAPMGGTRIVEGSIFTADTTVFAQWTYIGSGSSGDDYPIFTTPAPAPAPIGLPTTGDMTIFEMILSWLGLL